MNETPQTLSKTQLKREAHALQTLGEELVKLNPTDLAKIPLPNNLHEAIVTARNIKAYGGRKRQIQYIGKLMRNIDAEPISKALEAATNHYREDVIRLKKVEQWRDRLLSDGDESLNALCSEMPDIDRQHVRQLMRSAKKESEMNKPPKSTRTLFKYLRDALLIQEKD